MDDLKLNFIETGRLSDNEMTNIIGGSSSCTGRINCHENGKNYCGTFKSCTSLSSKQTCTAYWSEIDLGDDDLLPETPPEPGN
ncbi:MAG: hypothetical protein LBU51_04350 [Bacteroidales bacterium]|jgi:hypothetical protein|nr:hypothetical protein [Bacteroidales bacterium]